MDNPETSVTLATQYTGRKQTYKQNTHRKLKKYEQDGTHQKTGSDKSAREG